MSSKYLWALFYLTLIVFVNIGFSKLPLLDTPFGMLAPMTFFVGFVFIVRDYAQRAIGHNVLYFMLAALALSYIMADPFVAFASAAAFFASELIDWIVYTVANVKFKTRVAISSAFSVPIDSAIFLTLIGHFSISGFLLMCVVKFSALFWLAFLCRKEIAA